MEQTKVNTTEKRIHVTGLNKSTSIFARLGGKSDTDDTEIDEDTAIRFAGTIKTTPKKVNKRAHIHRFHKYTHFNGNVCFSFHRL